MDPSYKHLVSDMKIARIHKLRTRPTSSTYQGNARDPKWIRLFQPSHKINLKLKISKLQPYCTKPRSSVESIKPRFLVKTQSLTRVLSHKSIEKEEKQIDLALKTIPEFSSILDRSLSLSKILAETAREKLDQLSRPNTARVEMKNLSRPSTARQTWMQRSRPNTARLAWTRSEKDLSSKIEVEQQSFGEVIREIFKH